MYKDVYEWSEFCHQISTNHIDIFTLLCLSIRGMFNLTWLLSVSIKPLIQQMYNDACD